MAGNGPIPNTFRSRARDNAVRDTVKSDGKLGGFALEDLPEDFLPLAPKNQWPDEETPVREQWHPATLRWWHNWRASPQAARMLTEPDWDYLLDTALLHHQMWESGGKNSERAAEIRIRVAMFGATYGDRLKLRLEVEAPPEEYPVGKAPGDDNIASLDDRRNRITGT